MLILSIFSFVSLLTVEIVHSIILESSFRLRLQINHQTKFLLTNSLFYGLKCDSGIVIDMPRNKESYNWNFLKYINSIKLQQHIYSHMNCFTPYHTFSSNFSYYTLSLCVQSIDNLKKLDLYFVFFNLFDAVNDCDSYEAIKIDHMNDFDALRYIKNMLESYMNPATRRDEKQKIYRILTRICNFSKISIQELMSMRLHDQYCKLFAYYKKKRDNKYAKKKEPENTTNYYKPPKMNEDSEPVTDIDYDMALYTLLCFTGFLALIFIVYIIVKALE